MKIGAQLRIRNLFKYDLKKLSTVLISLSPFIACSNCPWDLDPAFIRRFSRRIFIDLPTDEDAIKILKLKLGKHCQIDGFEEHIWDQIAVRSRGKLK